MVPRYQQILCCTSGSSPEKSALQAAYANLLFVLVDVIIVVWDSAASGELESSDAWSLANDAGTLPVCLLLRHVLVSQIDTRSSPVVKLARLHLLQRVLVVLMVRFAPRVST